MRISDWSSDVCSSDLWGGGRVRPAASGGLARNEAVGRAGRQAVDAPVAFLEFLDPQRAIGLAVVFLQRVAFMLQLHPRHAPAAARMQDRKSVVSGKSVSVSVDLGGRRNFKKTK